MISILFWNLMGNEAATWATRSPRLRDCIGNLVGSLNIDVFVFAESGLELELATWLSGPDRGTYRMVANPLSRTQIYSRLPQAAISERYLSNDGRLTIQSIQTSSTEFLLAALHFHSPLDWGEVDQALQAVFVRDNIARTEDTVGHQRTVLIGDLNMNPFSPGVAGTLGAVMTRDIARSEERTVAGVGYRFFYNPMWGLFGDATPGPAGTLYYSTSTHVNYYWNMLDQVLLRPALMDRLADLRIVDQDGRQSLLTNTGRPRGRDLSDHLPILCRLDI